MELPPNALWIMLGAFATFAATQVWPAVRGWLDADFRARRERERRSGEDREERYLKAMETIAATLTKIETVLDAVGRHDTARTFEMQEMRRDLNEGLTRIERAVGATIGSRRGPRTEPRP